LNPHHHCDTIFKKKGKIMSGIIPASEMPDMTGFPTFLFVIDGEIVDIHVIRQHETTESRIAVLSSDPKVYVLEGGFPGDELMPKVGSEWPSPFACNPNVPPPESELP
jgi:hypothetical protein